MSSIWLTDVVKKYSGAEDIEAWLDQLKLILELQKTSGASVDLAAVIPLFLEGQVYDVYAELGPDVCGNVDSLEGVLRVAFSLSPFMVFTKFQACSLWEGKILDAFLTNIRFKIGWIEIPHWCAGFLSTHVKHINN